MSVLESLAGFLLGLIILVINVAAFIVPLFVARLIAEAVTSSRFLGMMITGVLWMILCCVLYVALGAVGLAFSSRKRG